MFGYDPGKVFGELNVSKSNAAQVLPQTVRMLRFNGLPFLKYYSYQIIP